MPFVEISSKAVTIKQHDHCLEMLHHDVVVLYVVHDVEDHLHVGEEV